MRGVEQFGDYGIMLGFAMTTRPGHQTQVRRRAKALIKDAFKKHGIHFASPTAQVAGTRRNRQWRLQPQLAVRLPRRTPPWLRKREVRQRPSSLLYAVSVA